VLVEATPKAFAAAAELMANPMIALWRPLSERYSDEQIQLFIDFTRAGRELQDRHAEWLRERLENR
jgi:hypothetical protein